ncbi:hypothetical protein R5R35_011042 [Gryllus longicercus]|uniref:Borealin C-terminal domain-containing protein n=1 Tax=Gryllus longicercus TaxID=2509291 RepID=A0AAN9VGK7_9ORTH
MSKIVCYLPFNFSLLIVQIVKKGVEDRGKKAREPNQAFESLMFQFPPDMLKTKLKDLSVEPSENVTNQCREKGPGVTQGSPGRIINFESRCTPGVPHTRSLLQVATESNMSKVAGANSLSKFIATPSASGVSSVGILRIPEPGECAVSANGSPLLVTSSVTDTVNINIPLKNGKKITILPNADVIPNAILDHLDDDVKTQLKLLTNTLSRILKEE